MVSKKRRLYEKRIRLDRDFSGFLISLNQIILPRPKIRETSSYLEKLTDFRERYLALNQQIQEADMSNKDFFKDYTRIHTAKINSVIDSCKAQVSLRKIGLVDNKEIFRLRLQEGGMKLSDLEGVVEAHRSAIETYFQFEGVNIPMEFINVDDRIFYEDIATEHKSRLDKFASRLFGTKIHTKLDVNVKENNPHQWLGWINIGYEWSLSKLVALIAHEGPFGHQTHANFSKEYSFNHSNFSLTTEGLAMLGSNLALNNYFFGNPENEPIAEFEHARRWVTDTLTSAVYYLAGYEKLGVNEMADQLATDYFTREELEKGLSDFDKDKLRSLGSCQPFGYFVGYNKVKAIHDKGAKIIFENPKIKNSDEKQAHYASLLRELYMGMRTPEVMEMEIDLFLKRNDLFNNHPPILPETYASEPGTFI